MAQNYLARQFEYQQGKRQFVIYPEVCAGYGSLTVAELTKNKQLKSQLIQKFETLWSAEGQKHVSPQAHVDYRVFGVVPLQLYMQTGEQKFLDLGRNLADQQWTNPTPDGITAEARYWIDDMYMITAVQVQAYRATRDAKYIDRAALTMAAYLDKLQQPNGLFYHAPDSKFFWGRGVGWVAAGMAELLRSLPKKHASRARIMEGYRKMMAALLKHQGQDGLWRQLIDHPESWAETSSTGMFTFSMITGVKNGWLDARVYGPAARRIKFGTESNGGFKNITISNIVFDHCRGLALETVDGGILEDITISNITMRDIVNSPIFLRLGSRMRGPAGTPVGKLRRVQINNLVAHNVEPRYASIISGIPGHRIEGVKLSNIRILYKGGGTLAQAAVMPPEKESNYPEPSMFGDIPAYGFFIRHADGVELSNVEIGYSKEELRPAFVLHNVNGADFFNVDAQVSKGASVFQLQNVMDFGATHCKGVKDTKLERVAKGRL